MSRTARGCGQLGIAEQERALKLLRGGAGRREVATLYGVTKDTIAGLWRRHGEPATEPEPSTVWTRCDAMHARLDSVLAENVGVGRIAGSNEPPPKRPWK